MTSLFLKAEPAAAPQNPAKAKWQMTRQPFDKLLASLAEDRDAAGEAYLLLRRNLVRFFETRGFSEAEDASDEVLNRLARKLDAGETFENVHTYALGVARFVVLELRKSPAQKTSNELPEIACPPPFEEEEEEREFKLECLRRCLLKLPQESRELILAYYQGEGRGKIEKRRALAEKLGIPPSALRSRAVRLREKLETSIRNLFLQNQKYF